ncbi:hypothetical protein [Anditalea andensis]|uniref:DUF3299 domain-containing protein n=1 Tax=Anditalea andensis TaxID=1048983 RepID=A0A074LM70_9BACT|nr:hypothetical protein [Anditalea andensis]KEO74982.1 hypothetical protein EL17_04725 [Anditalea andensis]
MKAFKIILPYLVLLLSTATVIKEPDIWALFSKTRFTERLNRELSMYFLYPTFPDEVKALDGKEIILSGFYIPLDFDEDRTIIISKFPMAQCFFCGGAGSESVAVAYLQNKPNKRFKTDQIIKVKGTLTLNEKDVDELNFILKNAKIIE